MSNVFGAHCYEVNPYLQTLIIMDHLLLLMVTKSLTKAADVVPFK